MARRGTYWAAEGEAESLIRELGITALPVEPVAIAEKLDIAVHPMPPTDKGVSGMLIKHGDNFGIGYATHIDNPGFQRFSIAHELGHYRLPGHVDALFDQENRHESLAGFRSTDKYEAEADHFAAALLMPGALFKPELKKYDDGLGAVEALASLCKTSLEATAIRYIEMASVPVAMIVSSGNHVDYCRLSSDLQDFSGLQWLKKGAPLPNNVATKFFNRDQANIQDARRDSATADLSDWFGGRRKIPGTEEIIGLGSYGKTLTILSSDKLADDEDEDEDLAERWSPQFRR